MPLDIVKVLLCATIPFLVGIALTPAWTDFLYSRKMWKKKAGKVATTGEEAVVFNALHQHKEVGTPRMGGVIIWASVIVTGLGIWLLSKGTPFSVFDKFDFISRNQTWLLLLALALGAGIGLIDDLLEIKGSGTGATSKGLSLRKRLALVGSIGIAVGAWFHFKLGVAAITLPFLGSLALGVYIIPLFALIMIGVYAGGVIDGLDGLAGGVFAVMFSAYAFIAYSQNQLDVAAFCAAITGATLAFLWYNIPPARFYMSETGSMALTIALSIVAFMTDDLGGGKGISVLPIIAFPLVATAASSLIQVASKRLRGGKKVFLVAPLHHHFEALGWPSYKVVMRYWVISVLFAFIGILVALVG